MRDEHTVQIPDAWLVPTVADRDAVAWSPGRYRLCFEVASGGMASVFLALYHGPIGFERVVALKTIHPHLAKEKQFIDMFLDEARIAAHIDHPFVCKVVDFGEAKDSYYIAMEYLVGEPLSGIWEKLQAKPALAASPQMPFVLARIASGICEGLHAAHELTSGGRPMDIVHRDVSPANLFVLYDGTVRVVDFGIAKATNKLSHTETGTVKGKYAYLSPEQLSLKDLDRRSDIFSLGVVMWEMLTGRRLFKHDAPMETMNRVMNLDIQPPSSVREMIPAELDTIVLKALSRRRSDRYTTARAMARDLEEFLGSHSRTAPHAEVAEWLDDLFPGEFARKRKLMELTRAGDTAVPAVDARIEAPTNSYGGMEPTNVRVRSRPVVEAVFIDEEGPTLTDGHTSEAVPMEDEPTDELRPSKSSDAAPTAKAVDPFDEERARIAEEPTDLVVPTTEKKAAPPEKPSAEAKPEREAKADPDPDATEKTSLALDEDDVVAHRPRRKRSNMPLFLAGAVAIAAGVGTAWYTTSGPIQQPPVAEPEAPPEEPPPVEDPPEPEPPQVEPAPPPEPLPAWIGPTEDVERPPEGEAGRVHVNALGGGWGDIFYEGHRIGRTGEHINLPTGERRLLLRPNGSADAERPLSAQVREDRTVYLSVTIRAE